MTIDYGFATSDEVKFDPQGLPVGEYHVLAKEEEQGQKLSETNPFPVIVTYKVLDGDHKGREGKVWYNVNNASETTANIAKQAIKRIAEVTGRAVVPNTAPIKGRVFKVIVALQKGSDSQTNIVKYLPSELEDKAPF